MNETTFREMTIEQLGDTATNDDLNDFREACERVMASTEYDRDEQGATDYVWNSGAIRFEADTCLYCNRAVADRTIVPAGIDAENWAFLEAEHEADCEWFTTRAHRLA